MNNELAARLDHLFRQSWAKRRQLLWRLLKSQAKEKSPVKGAMPRNPSRFTPEQYEIISALDRFGHGVPVKDITEMIDLPHANVTRTLDRLEKKGLVRRSRGKDDRRQVIIHLTLEGTHAARRMAQLHDDLCRQLWGSLSESELGILINYFDRILQ